MWLGGQPECFSWTDDEVELLLIVTNDDKVAKVIETKKDRLGVMTKQIQQHSQKSRTCCRILDL